MSNELLQSVRCRNFAEELRLIELLLLDFGPTSPPAQGGAYCGARASRTVSLVPQTKGVVMSKSTDLREQASLHMHRAEREGDADLRRSLTTQALALAQLAEEVEREDAHIRIIAEAITKYRQHRKQLPGFEPLEAEYALEKS
jgi:hypothetical protein